MPNPTLPLRNRVRARLAKFIWNPKGRKAESAVLKGTKRVLTAAGPAAVLVGISAATAAAIAGGIAAHDALTKDRDFRDALKESPTLRKNSARAYKHFMTLRRINKALSKDPMTAAGYMNKAMSYEQEGIDPSIVMALADRGRGTGVLDLGMSIGKLHHGVAKDVTKDL